VGGWERAVYRKEQPRVGIETKIRGGKTKSDKCWARKGVSPQVTLRNQSTKTRELIAENSQETERQWRKRGAYWGSKKREGKNTKPGGVGFTSGLHTPPDRITLGMKKRSLTARPGADMVKKMKKKRNGTIKGARAWPARKKIKARREKIDQEQQQKKQTPTRSRKRRGRYQNWGSFRLFSSAKGDGMPKQT